MNPHIETLEAIRANEHACACAADVDRDERFANVAALDAAIALMRGQSEAVGVVIDGVTYEQYRDEAGDEIGCDRCQSDSAYTIEHDLETVDDEEGPGRHARLCPFCYTTHAGSMLKYKFAAEAERRESNKHLIQCFNVLLNAQVQAAKPKDPADEQ